MLENLRSIPESWLPLTKPFFSRPAPIVAEALLGCVLLRKWEGKWLGGFISETEAYTGDDPASHSFRGPTPRTASMFAEPGTVYVYRSYGIHFCLNLSTGRKGQGEAVLLRAIIPSFGIEYMIPGASPLISKLCSGPGRLCSALHIDNTLDGKKAGESEDGNGDRDGDEITVWQIPDRDKFEIIRGKRIGISKAMDREWRFGWKGHQSLSKPFPTEKGNGRKRRPSASDDQ